MAKYSTLVLAVVLAGIVGCGVGVSESQGVPPGIEEGVVVNHSTTDADVNEQSKNDDQGALFSASSQGSRSKGAGRQFENLPGGWSPWLAGNPDGRETSPTYTFYGTIIGIEGYEQPYYGLVNLRLKAQDNIGPYYLRWTTSNFQGALRIAGIGANDRTIGVEVKEQPYYGLIDARLITYRDSGWFLTNNPDYELTHFAYCAWGYELGGIQVKEQAGYGIVDLRIFCKSI
jgi:hypothetical protein